MAASCSARKSIKSTLLGKAAVFKSCMKVSWKGRSRCCSRKAVYLDDWQISLASVVLPQPVLPTMATNFPISEPGLSGFLQSTACFDRQPEQELAAVFSIEPVAIIPAFGRHQVTAINDLPKLDPAEPGHSKKSRCLHLNHLAAFGHALAAPGGSLAVYGVGRPAFAEQVFDIPGLQGLFQCRNGFGAGAHFTSRRKIMVRGTLIAHGGGQNHRVPGDDFFLQHAAAAAGDQLTHPTGNYLLHETGCQRRADPGMEDQHGLTFPFQPVKRVAPNFRTQFTY